MLQALVRLASKYLLMSQLFSLEYCLLCSMRLISHLLVLNPGAIPDSPIFAAADKTVVFEEGYQTCINLQTAKRLAALPERSSLVCLIHTIPGDMSPAALKAMVSELTALSGGMFLTDSSDSYYHQFSPRFQEIVDGMT